MIIAYKNLYPQKNAKQIYNDNHAVTLLYSNSVWPKKQLPGTHIHKPAANRCVYQVSGQQLPHGALAVQ
jgi:hypothetical protein